MLLYYKPIYILYQLKISRKFIVTIPVKNLWWKGFCYSRQRTCSNEAQEQLWLDVLP